MNIELKPCPFCGTKVEMTKIPLWNDSHGYRDCYEFKIRCKNFGCTLNYSQNNTIYWSEEKAMENVVSVWNKRNKNNEDCD